MRRSCAALWVFAAATLIHVVVLWVFPGTGVFAKYTLAAEQLLNGDLPTERLVDFSPLYLELCVVLQRFVPSVYPILQGLQILAVALASTFLYLTLKQRLSNRLAVIGALALALDRHTLVYARIFEPEVCLLFLLCGFLLFVDRTRVSEAMAAGLFAALAVATRPTFLPVFLIVPALWWLERSSWPSLWRRGLAFLLPLFVTLAFLARRAESATGDFRTPVMNPGTVFFEGNNPLSHGTSAVYPPLTRRLLGYDSTTPDSGHVYYRTVARVDSQEELSIRQVNAYWSSRAWRFLRRQPRHAVDLWLGKLTRAFHSYRWHDISSAWELDDALWLPTVPFAVTAVLALLGCLLNVRSWRRSLLFYLLVASQLMVMLVFYVSARQRLAMLPALLFFALVAVERMAQATRPKRLVLTLAGVVLAVPLMLPNDLIRDETYRRRGRTEVGFLLQQIRQSSQTQPLAFHAERVVEAMAASPWWLDVMRPAYVPQEEASLESRTADALAKRLERLPSSATLPALFDLAVVELEAGRVEAARRRLEELVAAGVVVYRGPDEASLPRFYLARASAAQGHREEAVRFLEEALAEAPGDPFVLADLVALTDDVVYLEALRAYYSDLDAQFLLGRALLVHGRAREAAAASGYVVRRLPDFREARIDLAAALGESGLIEEGVAQYLEAAKTVEPIQQVASIVALFRRWADLHREDANVQGQTAEILYRHGRPAEALALLEAVIPPPELVPRFEQEKARLRRVLEHF